MLIQTTKGEMDEALLEKKTGVIDNDNETINWVEYWLDDELVHRSVDTQTNTVYVDFNNVSWPGASFTARGALIYNVTRSNASVAVLDFGSDKLFTAANNTVTMPTNTATTALIRFP